MPIVFLDRPVPGEYSVATDNFYGGQLAARHLAELGHRCIGLLCGEADIRNVAERLDGFMTELRRCVILGHSDLHTARLSRTAVWSADFRITQEGAQTDGGF